MQIAIRDDNATVLPDGAQGRIFVKSHDIVRRYFGSGENSQPDGWLDTGDLGFLIDGDVYITGRVKDVIIRGGADVHRDLSRKPSCAICPTWLNARWLSWCPELTTCGTR